MLLLLLVLVIFLFIASNKATLVARAPENASREATVAALRAAREDKISAAEALANVDSRLAVLRARLHATTSLSGGAEIVEAYRPESDRIDPYRAMRMAYDLASRLRLL
ncbi:hypothetical protein KM540_gp092 [Western grey kangaroopox virus]|uniref:Uncharacterized protein n=1 Tax=Western grey kangaroopox virus TaxID=1566307 RepID=A0A2C9DSP0_9POXV|nr:hypothetical protein KM540_gp092 [Western grey kangaroopox virus]ATI21023.1 hypothetical protein [Western grey kangaroopox virus]